MNAAVNRIGQRVGVNPDTLRGWCKQAAIDLGERPGTNTSDAKRIKDLEHENRELKRANEILLAALSFFAGGARPATTVVIAFIDQHRDRFGVEPICRVLIEHGCKIAPSGYYARKKRPVSARASRDADLIERIESVFWDRKKGRGISGARKVWRLFTSAVPYPVVRIQVGRRWPGEEMPTDDTWRARRSMARPPGLIECLLSAALVACAWQPVTARQRSGAGPRGHD